MIKERYVELDFDVVVVGGGLSGVCAAIAAARHGSKTALIQSRPVLGGNSSSEIRMHICGATCHMKKKDVAETGILEELLLENKVRNPYHVFSIWDTVLWEKVRFQPNLELFLNTAMNGVHCQDDQITEISTYQLSTEKTIIFRASIYVDATGDGTLGFFSSAEYRIGSESKTEFNELSAPDKPNQHTMGNTIMFQAEDKGVPVKFKKPDWAYSFNEENFVLRGHGNMEITDPNYHGTERKYNADAGYWWIELGGTSDDIIADNETIHEELLKALYGVWDHIKNGGDHGAENYDLTWIGAIPGTRESRRLIGDYILNENDIRSNRIFEDAVAYGGWAMDEHPPLGLFSKGPPARSLHFPGVYTIPYRCFYSKNVKNLMMAGRNISSSKMAMCSTRVMGTCAVGGQAVGTAAALAIKYGCAPRDIGKHIQELQQELIKDDCYIPGYGNADLLDLARQAEITASSHLSGSGPELVINGMTRRINDEENCWESNGIGKNGETLTILLQSSSPVRHIQLTFDPDLTSEIMPTIAPTFKNQQVKGVPPTLVKDYGIYLYDDAGQLVYHQDCYDNYQRQNILDLSDSVYCNRIDINVKTTNGYGNARIFEVRVYE